MNKLNKEQMMSKKKKTINIDLLPSDPKSINFLELASGSGYKYPIEVYKVWHEQQRSRTLKRPF